MCPVCNRLEFWTRWELGEAPAADQPHYHCRHSDRPCAVCGELVNYSARRRESVTNRRRPRQPAIADSSSALHPGAQPPQPIPALEPITPIEPVDPIGPAT